jgi:hypothetical protein
MKNKLNKFTSKNFSALLQRFRSVFLKYGRQFFWALDCKKFISLFFLFVASFPAFSFEFGFLLRQDAGSENLTVDTTISHAKQNDLFYSGNFSSWFSFKPSKNSSLYLQGSYGVKNESIKSNDGNDWKVAPELDRAEFSIAPSNVFFVNVGRVPYRDILGLFADGNFDGANLVLTSFNNEFSAGAFTTSLLYKETAGIFLSEADYKDYYKDTYFAPPHYFFSLSYNYLTDETSKYDIGASLISQHDIHTDVAMQSIYLLGKFSYFFTENFNLNAGAIFGFSIPEDFVPHVSVSALFDISYVIDYFFPCRIGFETNLFYGNFDNGDPMPIITKTKVGYVFEPLLTRLMSFKASYLASFSKTFSFEASFAMFMRLDKDIIPTYWLYSEFENHKSKSLILGEEIVLNIVCAPLSDISFYGGTGLFIPSFSETAVYLPYTPIKWDIRLGLLFSF